MAKWNADPANIAAQRDEAIARAEVAEAMLAICEARREGAAADREWWVNLCDTLIEKLKEASGVIDDLRAELARIRAADRTSITVRTTEAAKMRRGEAL